MSSKVLLQYVVTNFKFKLQDLDIKKSFFCDLTCGVTLIKSIFKLIHKKQQSKWFWTSSIKKWLNGDNYLCSFDQT